MKWESLSGAQETIAKYRPSIVCELLPRVDNAKAVKLIHEMGYAAFAITRRGCFRMSAGDFAKPRSFRDFLLVPNEGVAPAHCLIPFEEVGPIATRYGKQRPSSTEGGAHPPLRPLAKM